MSLTRAALLSLVLTGGAIAAVAASDRLPPADWDAARADSQKSCRPILLELGGPWCPACRAMDAGPLSSAGFRALARRLILVREDVAAPRGKDLQRRLLAPYVPTYILVRPDGREVGRTAGAQPQGTFLARLASWLKKSQETPCKSSASPI